jgi:hypothetical protein
VRSCKINEVITVFFINFVPKFYIYFLLFQSILFVESDYNNTSSLQEVIYNLRLYLFIIISLSLSSKTIWTAITCKNLLINFFFHEQIYFLNEKKSQLNIICIYLIDDDIKRYGKKNIVINRNCRAADTLVI